MAKTNDEPAISGSKDEMEADAKKFREASRIIAAQAGQSEEIEQLAQWLNAMSEKFQNVASGYAQNSAPVSYDPKSGEEDSEKDDDEGVKRTVSKKK